MYQETLAVSVRHGYCSSCSKLSLCFLRVRTHGTTHRVYVYESLTIRVALYLPVNFEEKLRAARPLCDASTQFTGKGRIVQQTGVFFKTSPGKKAGRWAARVYLRNIEVIVLILTASVIESTYSRWQLAFRNHRFL